MNQDKMHLINKIFNNETIRTVWDNEQEKYFVSVVDIVGAISESKDKQSYWRKLKQRLKKEGNETVTNCHALKLKAQDGKYRMTDVVDIKGMFRIIESIPSKNAEPIKGWLAKLGSERIDEVFDPSIAAQRSIDLYRSKGYDIRYGTMIVNPHDDYSIWRFSTVLEEFAKYKGIQKSKLKKTLGDAYEEELLQYVVKHADGIIQLA